MSDKLQNLRRRLLELEELHATGFVDLAQYEESRALLEHWIVAAVLEQGGVDAPAPANPQPDPSPREAEPATAAQPGAAIALAISAIEPAPQPAPSPTRRRWPVWLAAATLLPASALGLYGWLKTRDAAAPVAVPPVAAAPSQADVAAVAAARVEPLQLPPPGSAPDTSATAASPAATLPHDSATPGAAGRSIAGTVTLAPALAQRVRPRDTLFIYARAIDGPPMPLAVIRKQVKDLPFTFVLDDAMAVWPEARVSAFPRVVVTARVSRSGEGKPMAGDLEGQSPVVAAGAAGVAIEIASVVPAQVAGAAPVAR
jgi:hypothetical protein